MKSKKLWLEILAIVMVLGIVVVSCDDGSTGGGTDTAVNGTWVDGNGFETTMNNGDFFNSMNGTPMAKGIYTTNNGSMTSKATHLWGTGVYLINLNLGLDSRWYTKSELQSYNISSLDSLMQDAYTITYSVSGNTFTFSAEGGQPITYTRK